MRKLGLLVCLVGVAGCGRGDDSAAGDAGLPPPACRGVADCEASGMPGAYCYQERCVYFGKASGTISVGEHLPAGTLRILAYRRDAFMGPLGPACDAHAFGKAIAVADPEFPYPYTLTDLPNGELMLYAFIDCAPAGSAARVGVGDHQGLRPFQVAFTSASAKNPDGTSTNEIDAVIDTYVTAEWECR